MDPSILRSYSSACIICSEGRNVEWASAITYCPAAYNLFGRGVLLPAVSPSPCSTNSLDVLSTCFERIYLFSESSGTEFYVKWLVCAHLYFVFFLTCFGSPDGYWASCVPLPDAPESRTQHLATATGPSHLQMSVALLFLST